MLKVLNTKKLELPYKEKDLVYSTSLKLGFVPFSEVTEKYLLQAFTNETIYPHFVLLGNSGLGKKTILKNIIKKLFQKEPVFDSFSSLSSWLGFFKEKHFEMPSFSSNFYKDPWLENEFVEKDNLKSEFSLSRELRGGNFFKAKNNFLILDLYDVSNKQFLLEFLISVLRLGQVQRAHLPETLYFQNIPDSLFPIPIEFRVILVGEEEDFEKILKKNPFVSEVFKMKISLDYECKGNIKNIKKFSLLLDNLIKTKNSPSLDNSAKLRILEEMFYLNENRSKFSTNLGDCKLIYDEASTLFKNKKRLSYNEIEKSIQNIKLRTSTQKQKYYESIQNKLYDLPLKGKRLGRIYGLSIFTPYISIEEYGQVSVISARVGFGNGNFINIERESNMSGDLHDKGIFILQSYLKGLFPKTQNIGLDISILFEQSSSTIDGDSATVAELLACFSALSGIEIPSQIAVTGAMSQYGEALAVGAVSQKIEAWFEFVNLFGEKKQTYSVFIPKANKENLVFSKKLLESMSKRNFLIITYAHVSDLIPKIFGISLGNLESNGMYTKGSLLEKIEQEWDKEKK